MTSAAASDPVIIDFESSPEASPLTDGMHLTNQYEAWGVSYFSTTDPAGPVVRERSFPGMSGTNALSGYSGDLMTNAYQPIIVGFDMDLSAASVVGLDIGDAGLMLTAYSATDEMVDQMVIEGASENQFATLSVSGENIRWLEVSQVNPGFNGDGYMIDDLWFTSQPIPAPAAGALLGLAGLAGARRRRWNA
jgi:hypothetical protein